jgi:succinate dehydrogenase/fumarate reductase-like Fe-S protein
MTNELVTINVMGRRHEVPAGLTIMKAIEHAGHRMVAGVGCRAGFCGACAIVYRSRGSYKLRTGLACQTQVEDGMVLASIPYVPAHRADYTLSDVELDPDRSLLASLYPELARCISCNACSKACPQTLNVMDFTNFALRDDLANVARESFDCIQCGLCALRCPAEIAHYHVAQLARRLHARYQVPCSPRLASRCAEIETGRFCQELDALMALDEPSLRAKYAARGIEEANR